MTTIDHIIDPGGEVIINLRNANSPSAQDTSSVAQAHQETVNDQTPNSAISTEDNIHDQLFGFRIQVSAQHLMFASPVFKNLLPDDWEEIYLQNGSVEIPADGWDLHAFLCLLAAIHHKDYHIPRNLETFAKVAVIAHYYECGDAIENMTRAWIPCLEAVPMRCSRDMILWVWISWFFLLPVHFNYSTSAIMTYSKTEIENLGFPIPRQLIRSLNKGRNKAIDFLLTSLYETRDAFQTGDLGCGFECRRTVYHLLTRWMNLNDLDDPEPEAPFTNLSYSNIKKNLKPFERYACGCSESKFTSLPPYADLDDILGGLHLPLHF